MATEGDGLGGLILWFEVGFWDVYTLFSAAIDVYATHRFECS